MSARVLYLSRGRGYGHAVPDLTASRAMLDVFKNIDITFASYTDGLSLLCKTEYNVIPMQIDSNEEFKMRVVNREVLNAIEIVNPDLIISHEVFFNPLIARKKRIPSIFLTHWFFSEVFDKNHSFSFLDNIIGMADRILFLDIERFHKPTQALRLKTKFIGPLLRTYTPILSSTDNSNNFIIPEDFALVAIGGRIAEYKWLLELILSSYARLEREGSLDYEVVIIAPNMSDYFTKFATDIGLSGLRVMEFVEYPLIYELESRARYVVGRGSFNVMSELAVIGTPSLQILCGDNSVDTFHARNFEALGTVRLIENVTDNIDSLFKRLQEMPCWSYNKRKDMVFLGEPYRTKNAPLEFVKVVQELLNGKLI